jgi:hypothetical protein
MKATLFTILFSLHHLAVDAKQQQLRGLFDSSSTASPSSSSSAAGPAALVGGGAALPRALLETLFPQTALSSQDEEERLKEKSIVQRQLFVTSLCNSDQDVSRGPAHLISELTNPLVYDKTKRPTESYYPSRPLSTNPDYVFTQMVVSAVVAIDELTQSMTTRYAFHAHTYIYIASHSLTLSLQALHTTCS